MIERGGADKRSQRPTRGGHRRRGMTYVFVLGSAMLVTAMCIGAVTTQRIALRSAMLEGDAVEARMTAQTAVELVLAYSQMDRDWYDSTSKDAWSSSAPLGEGTWSFKLEEESSTPTDSVARLYGRGQLGGTSRVYSVLIHALHDGEGLTNTDFAAGVSPWWGYNCSVGYTDYFGPRYLYAQSRSNGGAGVRQTVTDQLVAPSSVDVSAQFASADESDQYRIFVMVTAGGTTKKFATNWVYIPRYNWGTVSQTLDLSWSGTLTSAVWGVETRYDDGWYYVYQPTMFINGGDTLMVPSTWRWEADE